MKQSAVKRFESTSYRLFIRATNY